MQAEADKRAAEDKAAAVLIEAKANADAKKLQAEADEKVFAVEAEGKRVLYEAENSLRDEQIELQRALAILKVLPEIVANSVKPLENIEGIKILQGYGAGGSANVTSATGATTNSGAGLADQITTAALNYRANAPMVDAMVRELGLVDSKEGTLNDLLNGNHSLVEDALAIKEVELSTKTDLNGKKTKGNEALC